MLKMCRKRPLPRLPQRELCNVAVPAEDPAGEPVAAAVGETAAEPPVEAAAPAEEPVGAAPVEEPETAVSAVASAGEAVAAPAEGIDFADEEAALAARSAGLDEEEPTDGEAVDEGAAGASDALFDGRSEEEMVSLFAKMLDEEPVQSLRRVVEAVKIAFYGAPRRGRGAAQGFVEAGGDEAGVRACCRCAGASAQKTCSSEYRRRRDEFIASLDAEKEANLKIKLQIIEELKELVNLGRDVSTIRSPSSANCSSAGRRRGWFPSRTSRICGRPTTCMSRISTTSSRSTRSCATSI